MSIIQDFQALQTGEQIGLALAIASVILIGLHWAWAEFTAWCDRQPIYDPMQDGMPDQQEIAAKHVSQRASSQLIGGLIQLDEEPAPAPSRPLPVRYPLVEEARRREAAVQRQMAADTIKGKRS